MKKRIWIYPIMILVLVGATSLIVLDKNNVFYKVGDTVDSFNDVNVYYNGSVVHVLGRNLSKDNYNIGLKYQCVEFVKRYYYEYLNHKMPNSYGHAKDFYDSKLIDGEYNKDRNLIQYSNPSISKPKVNDLIIFGGTKYNSYGHVAIVSKVMDNEIEIIQQNPGKYGKSRATFELVKTNSKWRIISSSVLGRLRKQ
ncbi:CHAP domain-containing protein [Gaetbulibacter aquiaggeris]|uniref:CHAP domain-containing protein n=1 Tax=Gaetbulibacter aquiaggeris TaxID=1735373 RepID=A0ABW7MME1_9FLAO